jgi:hypothetical protein
MSVKQWAKNKKKLVIPKDYIIFDATEDDDARMSAFTNVITMDSMNPPVKLVKLAASHDSDDIIDYDKIEKLEKEFFRGLNLRKAIMATVAGLLENRDINIFIVMRNKAFKYYKQKMRKAFEKTIPVDFTFVEIFKGDYEDNKKSLKYTFSDDELYQLKKVLREKEKESEKIFDKKYKKKDKKKKKK